MTYSIFQKQLAAGLVMLVVFLSNLVVGPSLAQETTSPPNTYQVNYDFDFYIEKGKDIRVDLEIKLKNTRPDVYVNDFTLSFPKNFFSENLASISSATGIPYEIKPATNSTRVKFKLNEPDQSGRQESTIRLAYNHKNLFVDKGGTQEAILPLLDAKPTETVNVRFHISPNMYEKISLAKPKPTTGEFGLLTWTNVRVRTLYVLFGESQKYQANLSYALANPSLLAVKKTIALPPDTLYQQAVIESLDPAPLRTYTDEDGNILAEYELDARQQTTITYRGIIEVFRQPRSVMLDPVRVQFEAQKPYLLSEKNLWNIQKHIGRADIQQLKNVKDIFEFVVGELTYDAERITGDGKRRGATKALDNAFEALCTDFTDVFVAIAREKGIYAREIEGIGLSFDQRILPSSFQGDVLHSWVEYYDIPRQQWTPLDPTWTNTSGIDYMSGFDTNHIVLAIHGKDPESPVPAGFYKTVAKKDVFIAPTDKSVQARATLSLKDSLPDKAERGVRQHMEVTITNTGNTSIPNIHILPEADYIAFEAERKDGVSLAPYESKTLGFKFTPSLNAPTQDTVKFAYDGSLVQSKPVLLIDSKKPPYWLVATGAIGIIMIIGVWVIMRHRKHSHDSKKHS